MVRLPGTPRLVGGDRGRQGREDAVRADGRRPGRTPSSSSRRSCLTRASAKTMPRPASSARSSSTASSAVMSTSTLASALRTNQATGLRLLGRPRPGRGGGSPRRWRRTAGSRSGRPAGRGRCAPAGSRRRRACRPGPGTQPWTASCGRATRCSISATDRPTASSTPYRMSKTSTPASAPSARSSSLRRNAGQPAEPGHVDQADGGVDDDARRARPSGSAPAAGPRKSRTATTQRQGDQRVHLGAAAGGDGERGAAAAAADREAAAAAPAPRLAAPSASSSWLASSRRLSPPRAGERPRGEDGVGVADEEHAERRQQQVRQLGPGPGSAGVGQPAGTSPTTAMPCVVAGRRRPRRRWPAAPRAAGRAAPGERRWHERRGTPARRRRSSSGGEVDLRQVPRRTRRSWPKNAVARRPGPR